MLKHACRATLALTTTAALTIGLTTGPAAAAGSDVTPQAAKAAGWLAGQLQDGLVVSEYQDFETGDWVRYTDHGLSLDVFFAFEGLGVKKAKRQEILDAIEPQTDAYTGSGDYAYAGATGKLLTAVQEQGINPSRYASGDLVSELEGLVHTGSDSEKGRAKDTWDASDPYGGDYSNTLGQAFVVRGLTAAGSPLADETAKFLLKQQCDEGFFRVYMESSNHTCDAGVDGESGPSVDATATAVLALLEVKESRVDGLRPRKVKRALAAAEEWLVRSQARDGSFADEGVANSNSTGLAAQALDELGRDSRATKAASWLATLRVTGKLARTTAFARRDIGAVAFSEAALQEGQEDGIDRGVRYQWRRSTAQAAVGLDALS